ncbi:MAG: ATP-binding protein [Polynucleobacter sp.]|nr:ATP-binding protein [Polynucleobacter sp.]
MEIQLPHRFDRDELAPFFRALDATINEPTVIVDFSPLTYSFPTAMLVAGSKLRKWVQDRKLRGHRSFPRGVDQTKTVHSYLMHLGFFDFIYMSEGNRIGQAQGSARYLPIMRIEFPRYDPHVITLAEWHRLITERSRELAGVLVGSHDDSEELRTYTYSIREIIRNVFEHSHATECYICGQRWMYGRAEIAIIDEGCGIARTIESAYRIEDDAHALRTALLPGASRINALPEDQNIYGNSGFGLYVLSNLAASFGWFAIGSGNARVIGYNNTTRQVEPFSFSGTFFGMRLNKQPRNFRAVLEEIIAVGEAESGAAGIRKRASGFSRLAD